MRNRANPSACTGEQIPRAQPRLRPPIGWRVTMKGLGPEKAGPKGLDSQKAGQLIDGIYVCKYMNLPIYNHKQIAQTVYERLDSVRV